MGSSASTSATTLTTITSMTVPFVSIETAGVFCRAFCDFRPNFEVANEDGEVPRETPLYGVKVKTTCGDGGRYGYGAGAALCGGGEARRSRGGIIEFQRTRGRGRGGFMGGGGGRRMGYSARSCAFEVPCPSRSGRVPQLLATGGGVTKKNDCPTPTGGSPPLTWPSSFLNPPPAPFPYPTSRYPDRPPSSPSGRPHPSPTTT